VQLNVHGGAGATGDREVDACSVRVSLGEGVEGRLEVAPAQVSRPVVVTGVDGAEERPNRGGRIDRRGRCRRRHRRRGRNHNPAGVGRRRGRGRSRNSAGWVGTGEEEAWEANACWRKDQPTQPAQTTAATIPLIRNRLALSTVDKRRRVRPQSSASRIRARRTATDSSSWVS